MQHDNLVRMANQIAKFFVVQGNERAVAGIADHVKKYWEPRMKEAIFAHLDAGGDGLEPLAIEALKTLRGASKGASPTPAASKAVAGSGQRGKAAAR